MFRPLVIVAHQGIFTSAEAMGTADNAIRFAQNHIESGGYKTWHFHKLIMDQH
jgi:hypothetical protein